PVIELAGLGVSFGPRQILNDLRISLSGRTIGLLGPNGAGKSTLIQTLLGFCPSSSGTATIFSHDIRTAARMIRLVREMKDSGEMHLVLCSHLLRDVEETCEEVLILKQGRIVHYSNL